jgi:hypothetical protein
MIGLIILWAKPPSGCSMNTMLSPESCNINPISCVSSSWVYSTSSRSYRENNHYSSYPAPQVFCPCTSGEQSRPSVQTCLTSGERGRLLSPEFSCRLLHKKHGRRRAAWFKRRRCICPRGIGKVITSTKIVAIFSYYFFN